MFRQHHLWHTENNSANPGRYSDLYTLSNRLIYFTQREEATNETMVASEYERKLLFSPLSSLDSGNSVLRSITTAMGAVIEGAEIGIVQANRNGVNVRLTLMESLTPVLSPSTSSLSSLSSSSSSLKTSSGAAAAAAAGGGGGIEYVSALNAMKISVSAKKSVRDLLAPMQWSNIDSRGSGEKRSQFYAIDRALNIALDGDVQIRSSIWHDAAVGIAAIYENDALSVQSELNRGGVESGGMVHVKSSVEIRPPRSNIEIYMGHTEGDFGVMGLARLVNHENYKIDLGAEVFSEKGEPANAGCSSRLTYISPTTHKRTNLVTSISATRLYAALTSELSKKYGVLVSSQLHRVAPDDASVLSAGLLFEPSKEIIPELRGEYTFQGRIDTHKGASVMVQKRDFLQKGVTANLSLSTRSPIGLGGQNTDMSSIGNTGGGLHIGFAVNLSQF